MINLYEYIVSYDIFDDITVPCVIISDITPQREIPTHITFYSISEFITKPIQNISNPCIIISHSLTSEDLLLLQKDSNLSASWISLNPWVMSMITKNHPENNDILNFLGQHYQVIEPIDIQHLLNSLQPNIFLRIHDILLPKTLQSKSRDNGLSKIIDTSNQSDYIVLTTPSSVDVVSSTIHALSQSWDFAADLYVQSTFSTELNEDLIKDIKRTQHIIVIIDHKATEEIWMYYDTLIKSQTQGEDITIQYIFPQFHLVASILPEYIYEEAKFDQPAFMDYLASHLV